MFDWFSSSSKLSPVERVVKSHHLRPIEVLPWVLMIAAYFVFDSYLPLGSQILIMILFAMSLDLVLGYAGIVYGAPSFAAVYMSQHGATAQFVFLLITISGLFRFGGFLVNAR